MTDWPPKGWNTGTPDEQMECLVVDGAFWIRAMATWVPNYGWWLHGRFCGVSVVPLWRPLPAIPEKRPD